MGYPTVSTTWLNGLKLLTSLTDGSESGDPGFCTKKALQQYLVACVTSSRAPLAMILASSFCAADYKYLGVGMGTFALYTGTSSAFGTRGISTGGASILSEGERSSLKTSAYIFRSLPLSAL